MRFACLSACFLVVVPALAQAPTQPNLDAQRSAMLKLKFLVGRWKGEARQYLSQAEPVVMVQTEEARYKLDGLILTIEGIGRRKSDGKVILQAFGIISYDDASGTYHMRAFNDGRFLETEVTLAEDDKGLSWGFKLGQIQTHSTLRITDKGDWTEEHEISVGSGPPKKFMELKVSREN